MPTHPATEDSWFAAQQLSDKMVASQPDSNSFGPFGYAFGQSHESLNGTPNEPAPAPAPGAPILSEIDNKALSSFFEEMSTNQYNLASFGDGFNHGDPLLDLPPELLSMTAYEEGEDQHQPLQLDQQRQQHQHHGHNQQLLQQQQLLHQHQQHDYGGGGSSTYNILGGDHGAPMNHSQYMSASHMMPHPPAQGSAPQQLPYHHDLSQRTPNGASSSHQMSGPRRPSSHSDAAESRRPPPVGHLRHQPLEEFKEEGRRSAQQDEPHEQTFAEWMYGPSSQVSRAPRHALPGDFQWGSDSNFSATQAYEPNRDTFESQSQEQLKCLDCLEPSQSANTTRPSSPIKGRGSASSRSVPATSKPPKQPEEVDTPPRKRRKSKSAKEAIKEEKGDEPAGATKASRQQKKTKKTSGSEHASTDASADATTLSSPAPDSSAAGKRRKSTMLKPPRENLTDAQKRENHIKSEQRRRGLIKEGFEDLTMLVPSLRGGGFSKSSMLGMTAEYLEKTLLSNQDLADRLAE